MKNSKVILLLFFIFVTNLLEAQETVQRLPEVTKDEILFHIKNLSSEKMHGRRTGEAWCDSAGVYIENEFKTYGLKPINNSYRQVIEFISSVKAGKNNSLIFSDSKKPLNINKDFAPFPFSSSDKVSGNLVFAGYGISYPDSNYDDYKEIDVKNKIVIVFSGIPDEQNPKSKFNKFSSNRYKAMIARDKGAKGIIIFSGPLSEQNDSLTKMKYDMSNSSSGIVSINLKRSIVTNLFITEKKDLQKVQQVINESQKPQSFEFKKIKANIQSEIQEIKAKSFNVFGIIEGNDSQLKDQYIVIGAHYDHLGMGGEGSLDPQKIVLHGGADDNASGTAGIMELAQAFSNEQNKIGRSLLIIAFTGEEEGLLGSGFYVKNPLIPVEKTVAMVNMDMIGRMKENKLIVNGAGTSKIFVELLNKYNKDFGFNLKTTDDGYSPSDNSSFYGKGIPVMMFFTDLHLDYHKPDDTWDKINADGEKKILDLVKITVEDLSNLKEKPILEKPKPAPARGQDMPGFKVSSGIIPQFGEQVEGVPIQGTKEGSPTAKAGLKGGDIIIKLGKHSIKSLQDYTYALSEFKPGDKTTIVWLRDGKEMSNEIEFVKR